MSVILEMRGIHKSFPPFANNVLCGVNLVINRGESVALVGESGSGKSTFLQIAGLLETPTSGTVFLNGESTAKLSDEKKTMMRRRNIGFVYQFHNLLPEFTSVENVMIPLTTSGKVSKKEASEIAMHLVNSVGLAHRANQYPKKLSGGEQQRIAIARAVATDPDIIIADEPTGSLDNKTSDHVFDLFIDIVQTRKKSLLLATHNLGLANKLDRQISLKNGVLGIQ